MYEVRSSAGRLIRRVGSREHAERLRERGHLITPIGSPDDEPVVRASNPTPSVTASITCAHRDEQLRSDECPSCSGHVSVKVYACDVHEECQLADKLPGVKSCNVCADRAATVPAVPADAVIAKKPRHSWEGTLSRKPWDYRVTATLAVLDPGESLDVIIETLRQQTERPYIVIVDTGSKWQNSERLHRRYESTEDVECHFIRSRAWRHSSACVGASLDLALATCHSEFLFATHDDVFLKRRDYIENLVALYRETSAVAIGYEMSPRDWLTDQWQGMVSHTATLFHVPTLHRIGASWSFERAHHRWGVPRTTQGWPDTETAFGMLLNELGMKPHLIGHETNYERFEDDNLVHCRSYTGSKLYSKTHHNKAAEWVAAAIVEAKARLNPSENAIATR